MLKSANSTPAGSIPHTGLAGSGVTAVSTSVGPNHTIGSINFANVGSGSNTTSTSLYITSDPPVMRTNKHSINIDEFYEDLIAIKQIMIEMAKDENLMERNSIIRDILATWLIKGLSK